MGGVRGLGRVPRGEAAGAARIVVTVVAAWQVALWLGADQPPVYAAVVPLVALRGDPVTALGASVQRSLGVVAGVLIGIAVVNLLRPSTAALAVVVALGLGVGMFLRASGGLNIQVAASSLLVFASASPDAYAWHRVWETVAGAVVTVGLAPLLWPPDPYRALAGIAEDCRVRVTRSLTGTAAVVGGEPGTARDNLALVREHAEAVHADAERAREAERAMRFNPLRRRHQEDVRVRARGIAAVDRAAGELVVLAGEVAAFAGREETAADLARARAPLAELAALVVRVVEDVLSGADPGPAAGAARAALAEYARTDSSPVAVALRRPFVRILEASSGG
ncbi:FUSC family protein [Streptomyces sp. NPDC004126]|uniref:FUSC family protein n=1 Tax=Streptomyces sp. NPDC004126 TaxID=3390695 RepID=UPI003D065206